MQETRRPAVSGAFYERDRVLLSESLKELFSKAKKGGSRRIVISPHAGYIYSGRTAASAISSLKKAGKFIVLGPNHTGLGAPFSIMARGSWETPLGKCPVDGGMARKLKSSCPFLEADEFAHMTEHSIEVQLPFMQHRFGKFRMIPICIMNTEYSRTFGRKCEMLGEAIAGIMKDGDVSVVASSDFSHYVRQEVADMKDEAAIERIMSLDIPGFFRELEDMDASVCGFGPIAVVMAAARKLGMKAGIIDRSSSGDSTGDYGSVVAYYAIGFG